MIIRVPVPALGEVIVLTAKDDVFTVNCNSKPPSQEIRDLPESTLMLAQCSLLNGVLIVYLADLGEEIDLTDLITKILGLQIATTTLNARETTFQPSSL